MLITKISTYSGREHTLDINVTEEQIKKWQNGAFIQNAMPNIPAAHREFLLSGITPEEWEELNKEWKEE